ncbi:MAG: hypothetical protein VYA34_03480 [Myxococcota bacterium]|nr:hypothetical protein [Myxococcota bacterium]
MPPCLRLAYRLKATTFGTITANEGDSETGMTIQIAETIVGGGVAEVKGEWRANREFLR